MRLNFDQIKSHIKQPLKTAYLISGDEPMQLLEAADLIRQAAGKQQFLERETYHIDSKFNWPSLLEQGSTMSLFGDKKILDIRLEKYPTKEGQEYLLQLLNMNDPGVLLLISGPKMDKAHQNKKWAKWISAQGVWIAVWPIELAKLPHWLITRAGQQQRKLTMEAAELLANRVQGNLLAAKQELDKIFIQVAEGQQISLSLIEQQSADNARFTPWELIDECCKGNYQKLPHILKRLRQEKVEPMQLARMLQNECLQLEKLAQLKADGQALASVYKDFRIWPAKQACYNPALKRYGVKGWQRLWVRALALEKIVIGAESGDFWDDCLDVLFFMAGFSLWSQKGNSAKPDQSKSIVNQQKNLHQVSKLRQQFEKNNQSTTLHNDSPNSIKGLSN